MKKKRWLSLLLALIMMVSLLPLNVFAAEVGSDPAADTTVPVEDTIAPEEESTNNEQPADEPAPVEEPASVEDEEPLAAAMPAPRAADVAAALSDDVAVAAVTTKPADGTSVGQPFPTSVIGSGHYRIPAFVTLNDGTLVAAADARWRTWNSTYDDAGDIDTIVSYSKDNGANWNYTFANYIENGQSSSNNYAAATFIDPALATDGKTVYMLVDLYPGQGSASQCSSASQSGSGYDSNGYLKLSKDNQATTSSTFDYYLKDGRIYEYDDNEDQGYTVDAYFNVTKDGTDCGNLFNYDNTCGFHPLMTSYLYLTTSTDGGATWSAPQMLNPQVKNGNEKIFLNSPGRGLVTSDGTIVFGAYTWNNLCLIYSEDGVSWKRVTSDVAYSNGSENEIVELADGTLRMFVRHSSGNNQLRYVDIKKSGNAGNEYTFGSTKDVAGTTVWRDCNVSAISYSKTYDGQQVLLVACPGSTSGRKNGKIFTFKVDASNNMTLANTYVVTGTNDAYSYSCLTEQSDGSIGLLYEKGDSGNITYANYDVTTVTGLTFASEPVVKDDTTGITAKAEGLISIAVEPKDAMKGDKEVSKTYTITLNDGAYTGAATLTIPVDDAFADCTGFYGKVDSDQFTVTKDADGKNFVCNVPHFSDVTIYGTLAETGEADKTENIELTIGEPSTPFTVDGKYTETDFAALDAAIATVTTADASEGGTAADSTVVSMNSDDTYTGIIGNGTQWMTLDNSGNIGSTAKIDEATEFTVTRSGSNYTIKAGNYYLCVTGDTGNRSLGTQTSSFNWEFSNGFQKTYTYSSYISVAYGLTHSNGWTVSMSASNKAKLYTVVPGTPDVEKTAITFTGVAPGETSVTVGDTLFNITVKPVETTANVNLTTGSSTTLNALNVLGWTDDDYTIDYALTPSTCVTLNNATVTAGSDEGQATVTATVKKDETLYATVTYTINVADHIVPTVTDTPFIGGDTTYTTYNRPSDSSSSSNVSQNYLGQDKAITALIITSGSQYDLDIASNFPGDVTWGSTDESVITVDGNGVVAAVATPTGDDVAEAYVTATIDGQTYAIPVTVVASSVTDSTTRIRTLDMYNNLEYNCTAYYSYRLGALRELPQGAQVFVQQDYDKDQDLITFFATPNEGYALTFVQGSAGEFFHTVRDSSTEEGYGYTANADGSCNDSLGKLTGGHEWLHDQLIGYTYNNSIRLGMADDVYLTKLHAMLDDAVKKGCDGGFFWSRYADSTSYGLSMQSDLYFIAEKLPEMTKVLTGVTSDGEYKPYADGMTVGTGDTLHYTIYVNVPTVHYTQNRIQSELGFTPEKGSPEINYNSFVVSDDLTKAKWKAETLNSESVETSFEYKDTTTETVNQTYKSSEANYNAWVAANVPADGSIHLLNRDSFTYTKKDGTTAVYDASISNTYAYHSDLTLTEANFSEVVTNGTITNTAKLEHSYKTTYSNGKGTATSTTVVVDIKVATHSYVIDFGLPITIDLSSIVSGAISFGLIGDTAPKYGTAVINGSTLTYTPNQILLADDFVTFQYTYSNGRTGSTGVRIYPATSVFYEEGFLTTTGSWETVGSVSGTQATEVLGQHTYNYGYDPAYDSVTTGSYKKSTAVGDTATFTFTGTGFQLYANSNSGSGIVTVYSTEMAKVYMIDTKLSEGDTAATTGQNYTGTYYSLPIISETNLDYGTYKVTIKHTNSEKPIYIDGVRVLGTMQDSNIYTGDLEDNPNFYELRDYVLKAIGVEGLTDSTYGAVKDMAGQVYNGNNIGENSAIVIDTNASSYSTDNAGYAQDLLDNGPKNELYLYGGQTLVFKVTTDRVMQLGLKAPTGSANFKLTVDGTDQTLSSLNTCVDMFYEIAGKADSETTHTVTITVGENSGVLSVTLLKICDDPSAAFATLTQDDIEGALLGIYGISKEETTEPTDPAEPTDPVQPTEPVEPTVPDEPDDEPDTLTTTLTVNYVNLFGRKVGTATLTKEMTDGSWRISAREINANAPAGRRALCLFPVTVNAGQQKTIVIPVL